MADRGNRYKDDPLSECDNCGGNYVNEQNSCLCPRCVEAQRRERQYRFTLQDDINLELRMRFRNEVGQLEADGYSEEKINETLRIFQRIADSERNCGPETV